MHTQIMSSHRLCGLLAAPLLAGVVLAACANDAPEAGGNPTVKYIYDRNSESDLAEVSRDADDYCRDQGPYRRAELLRTTPQNPNEGEALFRCM